MAGAYFELEENDIQRLVDKGFISIKRGMYEKYKKMEKRKL